MKKWLPWVALILCALLLAAVIFGVIKFVVLMNKANEQPGENKQSVEAYFEDTWDGFSLVQYDSEAKTVTMQKTLDVTYEQACSFGKECYEELALGHADTMKIMQNGCAASCGVQLRKLTVEGLSSDGQVIYSVTDDGSLTACWED